MSSGLNVEAVRAFQAVRTSSRVARRCRQLSAVLAHAAVRETVETHMHLGTTVQATWDTLMFYEEVPGDAPWLLRALLPRPVRTEGDKRRPEAIVRCIYNGGAELLKRITHVEEPHLLRFEVVEQRLGIEDCIRTRGGSYEIRACGSTSEVVLKTEYETYLRPRGLWRFVEGAVVRRLHRHILQGLGGSCSGQLRDSPLSDSQ